MKDLRIICSDKYITKEEMLDVLSRAVPESEMLKGQCDRNGWIYRIYTGAEPADRGTSESVRKGYVDS